jgi:hypothetical protein
MIPLTSSYLPHSVSLFVPSASAIATVNLTHSSFQDYLLLNSLRQSKQAVAASSSFSAKSPRGRGLEKQPSRLLRQDFQDQEGITDGLTQFKEIQESLQSLNYSAEDIASVWNIVGAVLEIGNISFVDRESPEGNVTELTEMDTNYLNKAADMLKITSEKLCGCLTTTVSVVRGETIMKPLNMSDSINAKNAICKALYSSLFNYIVGTINIALAGDCFEDNFTSIGVLDIFGFESFKQNEFEQVSSLSSLTVVTSLCPSLSLSVSLCLSLSLSLSLSVSRLSF